VNEKREPRFLCESSCSYSEDGDPEFEAPTYPLSELVKVRTVVASSAKYDVYYCVPCYEYHLYLLEQFRPAED
jgi:hypothetical protein